MVNSITKISKSESVYESNMKQIKINGIYLHIIIYKQITKIIERLAQNSKKNLTKYKRLLINIQRFIK